MDKPAGKLVPQLAQLYRVQVELYRELVDVLMAQEEAIKQFDYQQVIKWSTQAKDLFVKIDRKQGEIKDCQEAICRVFNWDQFKLEKLTEVHAVEDTDKIKDYLEELKKTLKSAFDLNEGNNQILQEKFNQVKSLLTEVGKGKQTLKAYKSKRQVIPRFLDKKS